MIVASEVSIVVTFVDYSPKRIIQNLVTQRNIHKSSYTIPNHWSLSIPPENIRKIIGFLMFSGGKEKMHWPETS